MLEMLENLENQRSVYVNTERQMPTSKRNTVFHDDTKLRKKYLFIARSLSLSSLRVVRKFGIHIRKFLTF